MPWSTFTRHWAGDGGDYLTVTSESVMTNQIDAYQLNRFLHRLQNTDVLIRFRLAGEGSTEFSKIIFVSERALILQAVFERRIIMDTKDILGLNSIDNLKVFFQIIHMRSIAHYNNLC